MDVQSNGITPLHLVLLGEFRLTHGERLVPIRAPRMRALIAYLALHPQATTLRQRLAFLFWPDSSERQARTNLRQLLHRLRQTFPAIADYLDLEDTLRWQNSTALTVDVQTFRALLAEADEAAQAGNIVAEQTTLERAVDIYGGHLLPDCYDSWLEPHREDLRQALAQTLDRLAYIQEAQGQYARALTSAERLLTLDEFNEATYRRLMRLHALQGDRARALRVYARCQEVFDNELGLQPQAATVALRDRLLRLDNGPTPTRARGPDIPLVGREEAIAATHEAWKQALGGSLHMLMIRGEAGVGKTRLAEELLSYVKGQGFITAAASCYEAEGGLAYGPITEWLRADTVYQTLLTLSPAWQAEVLRLLPELHADRPSLPQPTPLTESWQRQRLFAAIMQALLAPPQPLVLFVDNIQWCDADTLSWLHYLQRSHPTARILILATIREEAHANVRLDALLAALRRATVLTEMDLRPLDRDETARLAQYVAGQDLTPRVVDAVYHRTEGNPLFIVEMVRASLRSTHKEGLTSEWADNDLPHRVQAVIQERLARVSFPARRLLALAAIIGREFTYEILHRAFEGNEESVLLGLEELWQQRLIREQTRMAYDFSHGIIREVVHAAIPSARQAALHRRVATALESLYATQLDTVCGRLAYHWEHAGFPERAVQYHLRAGQVAQRLFANDEAEHHFQEGLRLCQAHMSGEERDRITLRLLQALSSTLVQARGYGAPQVQVTGDRVQALAEQLDESLAGSQLRLLALNKLATGQVAETKVLGEQMLAEAQHTGDPVVLVEAHYVLGVVSHWDGHFTAAREHLEQALALYESRHHRVHVSDYVQDPAVICRIRLSQVLWHLAEPLRSEAVGREALALARELGHPFSRAYALHWHAWIQNLRGDVTRTFQYATMSIAFSNEYQFPFFSTQSQVLLGWAMHKRNFQEEGLRLMQEGLARYRETGSEIGCAYYQALIGQALIAHGAVEEGSAMLAEAQAHGRQMGEYWSDPSIAILRGQSLRGYDVSAAESVFRKALVTGQAQGARMEVLQAAHALAALLRSTDRHAEAQTMHAKVWRWATARLPLAEVRALRRILSQAQSPPQG